MTSFDRERGRGRRHIAGRVGMVLLVVCGVCGYVAKVAWEAHALGWM